MHYKSSAGWVVPVSLLLAFTGFIPWGIFASTTDELRYMSHGFWWLMFLGLYWILLSFQHCIFKGTGLPTVVGEVTMNWFGGVRMAMCTLPVVSTLLYGSGIGTKLLCSR